MGSRDRRVDDYIARSAEFARPVLRHLRAVVHAGCPSATETLKWGMPHFVADGILCHMAAFQHHCAFGFWRHARQVVGARERRTAMGQFGRITSVADLPARRELVALVRKAAALGAARPRAPAPRRPVPRIPADLRRALSTRPRALAGYRALPPSARRDYVEWLAAAKRATTRARRLATAVTRLAAGEPRAARHRRSPSRRPAP